MAKIKERKSNVVYLEFPERKAAAENTDIMTPEQRDNNVRHVVFKNIIYSNIDDILDYVSGSKSKSRIRTGNVSTFLTNARSVGAETIMVILEQSETKKNIASGKNIESFHFQARYLALNSNGDVLYTRSNEELYHILVVKGSKGYYSADNPIPENNSGKVWNKLIKEGRARAEQCSEEGFNTTLKIYLPENSGYKPIRASLRAGEVFLTGLEFLVRDYSVRRR